MSLTTRYIALLLNAALVVLLACSPTVRYQVLTTLFDGVPPPADEQRLTVGVDTLGQTDTIRLLALTAAHTPVYDYHRPYVEKECAECHNAMNMDQMQVEEPQMCYNCHASRERYSRKHGPAAAGFCTSCHEPHKSENDHLLLAAGNNLCFTCHSNRQVKAHPLHGDLSPRDDCIDCHNPHSSENHSMLQNGACYRCHEEKINDYSFLHGPVAGNYCSTCHQKHRSGNEYLLVASGNDLCLGCHTSSTIYMDAGHRQEHDQCIACHNPHGGESEFMLN